VIPRIERLHPRPQNVEEIDDVLKLQDTSTIVVASDSTPTIQAATRLQKALALLGSTAAIRTEAISDETTFELRTDPDAFERAQAYSLRLDRHGARILGSDTAGTVYGVQTLVQWLDDARRQDSGDQAEIAGLEIDDWPDFKVRGILLDISRDRVPTMDSLFDLIDFLASLKVNQLQLYMEHTFAYRGHEVVWQSADPLTAEEVRSIDRYCSDRCVELVPNQNSFGHFHKWLIHSAYRRLAECPDGVRHPFNEEPEPFSLCPIDPKVLDLLGDLYSQLLPNFASSQFNVGLDETFDLGMGRSAEACRERGRGRVYLDYLKDVHRLVEERDHRMQFWADIVLQNPEVITELPPTVIPLEWGYEADHPFQEHGEVLSSTGLEFYLCPGTSSWNSLSGRTTNALRNLSQAAIVGKSSGATGYLITDWGDFGHMQPPSISYPGYLVGAGCAWNATTAPDLATLRRNSPELIDWLALGSPELGLGELLLQLGDSYTFTEAEIKNGSVLFFLLICAAEPLTLSRFDRLTLKGLDSARGHIETVLSGLSNIRPQSPRSDLSRRELEWVARLLQVACTIGIERLTLGREESISNLSTSIRAGLRSELAPLVEEYTWLWEQRSRRGGLATSRSRLERLLSLLDRG
jgi:hypothetical protein